MLHNHPESDESTPGELLLSYIKYEDSLFALQSRLKFWNLHFKLYILLHGSFQAKLFSMMFTTLEWKIYATRNSVLAVNSYGYDGNLFHEQRSRLI